MPYSETIGPCTLYKGDCFEIMESLNVVTDMILMDPPYGVTSCAWDKKPDLQKLWPLLYKNSKPNAVTACFCQMPFAVDLYNSNPKRYKYDLVFKKNNATGFLSAKTKPLRIHELIYIFYNGKPVYNPQKTQGKPTHRARKKREYIEYWNNKPRTNYYNNPSGERYPQSVISEKGECYYYKISSHTQKSIFICSHLIKTYSNEGELVFDPFMGGGSTGVACIETGRRFVGIEQTDKAFDIACRRIEAHFKGVPEAKPDGTGHKVEYQRDGTYTRKNPD